MLTFGGFACMHKMHFEDEVIGDSETVAGITGRWRCLVWTLSSYSNEMVPWQLAGQSTHQQKSDKDRDNCSRTLQQVSRRGRGSNRPSDQLGNCSIISCKGKRHVRWTSQSQTGIIGAGGGKPASHLILLWFTERNVSVLDILMGNCTILYLWIISRKVCFPGRHYHLFKGRF